MSKETTTMRIDKDLMHKVKILCAIKNWVMRRVVENYLKQLLKRNGK
jgi:hypothetical protein